MRPIWLWHRWFDMNWLVPEFLRPFNLKCRWWFCRTTSIASYTYLGSKWYVMRDNGMICNAIASAYSSTCITINDRFAYWFGWICYMTFPLVPNIDNCWRRHVSCLQFITLMVLAAVNANYDKVIYSKQKSERANNRNVYFYMVVLISNLRLSTVEHQVNL